ncbi:MAG: hypothetical protein JJU10_06000 [Idiomarina sp.]|nr:hypothetical protein [Idiomarina sp.]
MMSPEQSTVTEQQKRNRKVLLIVAGIFILPVTIAKLVLLLGWYEPGVSQKGNLLTPPLEISQTDNRELPATWRVAYQVPAVCDEACEHGLYVLSQVFHALGRMQNRVTPVGIQAQEQIQNLPELPRDSTLQFITLPETHALLDEVPPASLLIIDPLGNVVMWYEGSADRQHMIMQARDLLDDLKKLLKMSRVG